jgi:hypothetical protein
MNRIHRMILLGTVLALVLPLLGGCTSGPSSGRVTVDGRDGYLDLAFSDQEPLRGRP